MLQSILSLFNIQYFDKDTEFLNWFMYIKKKWFFYRLCHRLSYILYRKKDVLNILWFKRS